MKEENTEEFEKKLIQALIDNYEPPTLRSLIKLFCFTFLWYFFAIYGLIYFIKNTIDKHNLIPVIAKTIVWFENLF